MHSEIVFCLSPNNNVRVSFTTFFSSPLLFLQITLSFTDMDLDGGPDTPHMRAELETSGCQIWD